MIWNKKYVLMESPQTGDVVYRIYDWSAKLKNLPRPGKNVYDNLPDELLIAQFRADKVVPERSSQVRLDGPNRNTVMSVYRLEELR